MITVIKQILHKSQHVILYGVLMAILVFVLKWFQWKFLIVNYSLEIYIGLIAVLFTALGVWVATKLVKSNVQKVVVEKETHVPQPEEFTRNELEKFNLSNREYEVLQLLAKGFSNAKIADELFLSISTVKTHVSSLFVKMDVKSRTHAVVKAKKMRIV